MAESTSHIPKDPQPSVDRIDDLARRILNGDILLPKFQRNFVWNKAQVLQLLDSVYKNYPIGSVLLWQSRLELKSENNIAGLSINLPKPDYPVNYLLDGQQRLSTICGAMFWNDSDPSSPWNLCFDLRKEVFFHLSEMDDPPLHQIRLSKLSDPSKFFMHVSSIDTLTSGDKDKLKERANHLFNRFKDYKIASVTLGDMSIDDVAPIFERINSTGTRLTIVDLMRAATWSKDFDLVETINSILVELKSKDYGGIDRKAILRNFSAASGGGFSVESINMLRNRDIKTLKFATKETMAASKKAVDYFQSQIKIPNDSLIPYLNQFVVLTEIFRQIPRPNAVQYVAISKWFWRSSLSGYFAGWNTGMMSNDLNNIKEFATGKSVSLEVSKSKPNDDIWAKRNFRINNAHAKLFAIFLAYQNPIDLLTGQEIDKSKSLSWINSKEYHHFFPRAYLKKQNYSSTKINSLANFICLTSSSNKIITDRKPSDYLKDVERAAGKNLDKWLKSNLISIAAFEAGKKDQFDEFIQIRSADIAAEINKLADW